MRAREALIIPEIQCQTPGSRSAHYPRAPEWVVDLRVGEAVCVSSGVLVSTNSMCEDPPQKKTVLLRFFITPFFGAHLAEG